MEIRIKNDYLKHTGDILYTLKLNGQDSRLRSRFIKLLNTRLETVNEEYKEIIKEYSVLDEEGNPEVIEIDGQSAYDITDIDSYNKDCYELFSEDYVIEVTGDNEKMLHSVKDSLFNADIEIEGKDAIIYDLICEAFEVLEEN